MPYSESSDLLIGNVPLPPYINADTYIQNASDEIDAVIGTMYVTPVQIADSPDTRSSRLILKKACNMLASGRIIMAMDAGGQDSDLHKYGRYLVSEAEKIVQAIMAGSMYLNGATPLNSASAGTAPVIVNADDKSQVDAFYDNYKPSTMPLPPILWRFYSGDY